MLVLARKQNQEVCIGDRITITVLRVKGNAVRLGIEAPSEARILRSELLGRSDVDTSKAHRPGIAQQNHAAKLNFPTVQTD